MKNLKSVLAVVLVTLGATNAIQAQESDASLEIKGGLNMSNLYTEDVDDEKVLAGFNIGLFTQLPISSSLSLQPEFSYTTKGAELQYDNAFAEGTGKFRLNYIEVPVLLKANLIKNFNVQFGLYAAFLVVSKITNESTNGTYNFEENVNEDDLNKFYFVVAVGVGFYFDSFGIGARYNYGLRSVGKERTVLGQT